MDKEQFDDLKQFISGTVSQSEARVEAKLKRLEQKMDAGFAGVADTIDKATNTQLDDHEQRITALEQQAA